MRYTNESETIIAADDGRFIPRDPRNADYAAILASGAKIEPYAAPLPTIDAYVSAIERHMDAVAIARGYRSADRCVSYIGSTNAAWAAEAQAMLTWRDMAWQYAYTELGKVQAGQRTQPSVAEIVAEIPVIAWP